MYTFYTGIYCIAVHVDDLFALSAVCLLDSILHVLYRFFDRKNVDQLEERSLQNGIGTSAQSQLSGDGYCITSVEVDIILRNEAFYVIREFFSQLIVAPRAVEQEGASLFGFAEHIVACNIRGVVAGDELRLVYEIA